MGQLTIFGLALLIGGFMSSLRFILEKKEGAKKFCATMAPASGIIGIIVLIIGIYVFIRTISLIQMPLLWITLLVPVLLLVVNGLILSAGIFAKVDAIAKISAKLKGFQIPVGWMSFGIGILITLLSFSLSSIMQMAMGGMR